MHGIYFHHPGAFWLFTGLPIIVIFGWQSRAGLRPIARIITTLFRILALSAGITALADPIREIPARHTFASEIYFLEDASQSIGGDPAVGTDEAAITATNPGREFQKWRFAGGTWSPGQSPVHTDQTNLANALDTIGGLPGERAGDHIILLTDGRATRGVAEDAATRLALRGAHVDVVPVGIHLEQHAHFVDVTPPLGAKVGIPDSFRVSLAGDFSEAANIRLLDASGKLLDQRTIPFPGKPTLILHFTPREGGVERYQIEAEVGGHAVDWQSMPIYVAGPPRILLVDNVPSEATALARAIAPLHMPVDAITADHFPTDLTPYAAILLSDLSGDEFSPDRRGSIRQFVETAGGGLIFIGGENVIASRWNADPLRELLPVRLVGEPRKVKQKPPDVAVVFVLDCSGSMNDSLAGTTGNVSKLEAVKAAAIASLQAMPPTAHISVIAFEAKPHVIVPPTPVDQRQEIGTQIDGIICGGGTNMYPAIAKGIDILESMHGNKYLIVLTDGDSEPPPGAATWEDLSDEALRDGISFTSIGVGTDADQTLLGHLASRAHGRYAYCGTGDQIPQVFIERAKSMSPVKRAAAKPFTPLKGPDISDLPQLNLSTFPALFGSDAAESVPNARVLLLTDKHQPLLASWQFGAGKVFAFCSDAKNLWAKNWIGSAVFPKFWMALAAAVARPHEPLQASVHKIIQGNHVNLLYTIRDENGRMVEELSPQIAINPPAAAKPVWTFPQPGEYQVTFDLPLDNHPHDIDVTLQSPQKGEVHHELTLIGGTNQEMAATGPDEQACQQIAAAGNGVCSANPAMIAESIQNTQTTENFIARLSLWPWLVGAMICLWPIDVLMRKIL